MCISFSCSRCPNMSLLLFSRFCNPLDLLKSTRGFIFFFFPVLLWFKLASWYLAFFFHISSIIAGYKIPKYFAEEDQSWIRVARAHGLYKNVVVWIACLTVPLMLDLKYWVIYTFIFGSLGSFFIALICFALSIVIYPYIISMPTLFIANLLSKK